MSENTTAIATTERNEIAGFGSSKAFELLMRQAKLISSSTLVPEQFSIFDKNGKLKTREEQSYALSNATIAMEMAGRIGASPLMVCQNLYIVHGRPGWSSQFIIAAINASKKFSPLRFEIGAEEPEKEFSCQVTEWENGKKVTKTVKENIKNRTCVAWATENGTGERLESPPVSLAMAVQEGWFSKNGSKWQTMPELMLRYRAATLFGRLYAPEILMGMRSVEELEDIQDANVSDVTPSVPASKAILEGFGVPESILPENKEPAPPSTENPEADTAPTATDEEVIPVGEEVIPTDKLTFMYLDELSGLTGETQDDLIDTYSKSKYGCLADLMGALNDKTRLTMAYLSDVLVPALKAKVAELQEAA
jgi:hypothetical protein